MSRKAQPPSNGKSTRGRKPIFTESQKRVLHRMIAEALRKELRTLVKGL